MKIRSNPCLYTFWQEHRNKTVRWKWEREVRWDEVWRMSVCHMCMVFCVCLFVCLFVYLFVFPTSFLFFSSHLSLTVLSILTILTVYIYIYVWLLLITFNYFWLLLITCLLHTCYQQFCHHVCALKHFANRFDASFFIFFGWVDMDGDGDRDGWNWWRAILSWEGRRWESGWVVGPWLFVYISKIVWLLQGWGEVPICLFGDWLAGLGGRVGRVGRVGWGMNVFCC